MHLSSPVCKLWHQRNKPVCKIWHQQYKPKWWYNNQQLSIFPLNASLPSFQPAWQSDIGMWIGSTLCDVQESQEYVGLNATKEKWNSVVAEPGKVEEALTLWNTKYFSICRWFPLLVFVHNIQSIVVMTPGQRENRMRKSVLSVYSCCRYCCAFNTTLYTITWRAFSRSFTQAFW